MLGNYNHKVHQSMVVAIKNKVVYLIVIIKIIIIITIIIII